MFVEEKRMEVNIVDSKRIYRKAYMRQQTCFTI